MVSGFCLNCFSNSLGDFNQTCLLGNKLNKTERQITLRQSKNLLAIPLMTNNKFRNQSEFG